MKQTVTSKNNSVLSPFLQIDGTETIWLRKPPSEKQQRVDLFSLFGEIC